MKGSTILAMMLAAAAASAATIVALKKASEKRQLQEMENEEDLYDITYDEPEEECECEDTAEPDPAADAAPAEDAATQMHCKDGVCSLDLDETDDAADQPVMLHMDDAEDDTTPTAGV